MNNRGRLAPANQTNLFLCCSTKKKWLKLVSSAKTASLPVPFPFKPVVFYPLRWSYSHPSVVQQKPCMDTQPIAFSYEALHYVMLAALIWLAAKRVVVTENAKTKRTMQAMSLWLLLLLWSWCLGYFYLPHPLRGKLNWVMDGGMDGWCNTTAQHVHDLCVCCSCCAVSPYTVVTLIVSFLNSKVLFAFTIVCERWLLYILHLMREFIKY